MRDPGPLPGFYSNHQTYLGKGKVSMFNRKWSVRGAGLVGVLMLALLVSPMLSSAAETHSQRDFANIVLRLRVNPNITVAVGQPVNFDLAAWNFGGADATDVFAAMPLDMGNLKLTNASFTSSDAYLAAIDTDPDVNLALISYGRILPGSGVTATLTFLPQPVSLGVSFRGSTSNNAIANAIAIWSDEGPNGGGASLSNRVDFTVGSDNASDGTGDQVQQADVVPSRTDPTHMYNFVMRNFTPGEKLRFWVNNPDGSAEDVGVIDYADGTGLYEIDNFDTTGLLAGTYSFVAHGYDSGVDYLSTFTVK